METRSAILGVRLLPVERATLELAAQVCGTTPSALLRDTALPLIKARLLAVAAEEPAA